MNNLSSNPYPFKLLILYSTTIPHFMNHFRKPFQKYIHFNWQFGLFLILLFGIPRFFIVLNANITGNYSFTSLLFVAMMLTLFILLSKSGRKTIGLTKPTNYLWLGAVFILGIVMGLIVYMLGYYLYGSTPNNWYVYIADSYTLPAEALADQKMVYFIIFALIGMTFSPIGEELLYLGLIHQSFVKRFGENYASVFDSLAFAMVHIAHFGLIYTAMGWHFLYRPGLQ
ncbi:MAG: CPBP family intramembrane glutamic endopeptidase, partial [Aureibaculum sp.]